MRSTFLLSLSTALVAAWGLFPQIVEAQTIRSPATAIQTWRNTGPGMSTNARLGLYRVQNATYPDQYRAFNGSPFRGRTIYNAPYYAVTTNRSVPRAFVSSSTYNEPLIINNAGRTLKPFTNLRRPANAVERYWPLLAEGREDPRTGIVYWQLP